MPYTLDRPSVEGHQLDRCFNVTTLIDLLQNRARKFSDRTAFKFLEDDQRTRTITYAQLDESARRIGVGLSKQIAPGRGVALVFPPGLAFIENFFGCIYAGLYPIPATYPKPRRPSARLSAIVADARPAAILTTRRVFETTGQVKTPDGLHNQCWLSCEDLETADAGAWHRPMLSGTDIAFLQYTSGSTKEPRGVAVSHENITCNLEMIRHGFGLKENAHHIGVSWLPAYHDMGLIGGLLESLYVGGTTILMSPLSFLQRPSRWLRTISDHGAVISGGPNFAFELCMRKVKPSEMEGLDLSSWRVAFSGAEPIRAATLRRFVETFGPYGFSDSAFYPCYGLAEATLLVTGGNGPGKLTTCKVKAAEFQNDGRVFATENLDGDDDGVFEFVDCGKPLLGEELLIVDPDSRNPLGENRVGEIWIRGRNVAKGYLNAPLTDESPFNGQLVNGRENSRVHNSNGNGHAFLRTGDLGFVRGGSLFVTGRRKELLIIRGKNHYPRDIEATVLQTHDKLIPGGSAAFTVDSQGEPYLILVQEVDRSTTAAEHTMMLRNIRRDVTAEHDVFVHEVILIRMGSLSRTTSGKVRYADVRRQYLDDELSVVARWSIADRGRREELRPVEFDPAKINQRKLLDLAKTADQEKLTLAILDDLMAWLRQAVDDPNTELEPDRPLAELGLDSMAAMELIGHLETGLGLKLSPTVAWTYPTPVALAEYLAQQMIPKSEIEDTEVEQTADEVADDSFDQLLAELENMPEEDVAVILAAKEIPERPE